MALDLSRGKSPGGAHQKVSSVHRGIRLSGLGVSPFFNTTALKSLDGGS
jgi:hypothetical protein